MQRGITKRTQNNLSRTDLITTSLMPENKKSHRQSENPMAQTADSQPRQTFDVESEQTTSAQL